MITRLLAALGPRPIANTGSVARDHLANERTFLSWTRTGLGFVALGVALAKLDALEDVSHSLHISRDGVARLHTIGSGGGGGRGRSASGSEQDIITVTVNDGGDKAVSATSGSNSRLSDGLLIPSAALVGSGTGCLSYGTLRYFTSLSLLQKGLFRPNIFGIGLVAATGAVVAGGGIYLVVKEGQEKLA